MQPARITISGGFITLIAILYLFDANNLLPLLAITALAHELGHVLLIWALGGRVLRLHLGLVGLCIDYEGQGIGYLGEVAIALAGPLANLALAYGASLWGRHTGGETAFFLAGISLGAAVFNLLPIGQLDGGRGLYGILAYTLGPAVAGRVDRVLGGVLIVALFAAGLTLFFWSGWNFTLLTAAIWLLIGYCKSRGSAVQYAVTHF
ncbi:MAG: peptidase M50 [Oscillospiraceae bacterium]|nr:peptidase M50 [Oscillospiraceae bacterium]